MPGPGCGAAHGRVLRWRRPRGAKTGAARTAARGPRTRPRPAGRPRPAAPRRSARPPSPPRRRARPPARARRPPPARARPRPRRRAPRLQPPPAAARQPRGAPLSNAQGRSHSGHLQRQHCSACKQAPLRWTGGGEAGARRACGNMPASAGCRRFHARDARASSRFSVSCRRAAARGISTGCRVRAAARRAGERGGGRGAHRALQRAGCDLVGVQHERQQAGENSGHGPQLRAARGAVRRAGGPGRLPGRASCAGARTGDLRRTRQATPASGRQRPRACSADGGSRARAVGGARGRATSPGGSRSSTGTAGCRSQSARWG